MNAFSSLRAPLCALSALLSFGLSVEASAEPVTTTPVGAMNYSVAANSTISMGFPLLRSAVISGVVNLGSEGTVTLQQASGQTINLSSVITSDTPYYLEVVGHVDGTTNNLVGERFEINEASTIAAANNVLVLDSASPLNTSTGSNFVSLQNYRISIRPHWTLASIFGTGNGTSLNASTNINNADRVLAWTSSGFSIFYFRSATVSHWRNLATGTTPQDTAIIPPGVGIYFRRAAGDYSISLVGDVRSNRFIRPLDDTSQLLANGFPMDFSPADLLQNTASGYVATTSVNTADQLLGWVGGGYSIYYLRSGTTPQWRNLSTGTTDHTSSKLYSASGAVLYRPRGMPSDIVQPIPYSLN